MMSQAHRDPYYPYYKPIENKDRLRFMLRLGTHHEDGYHLDDTKVKLVYIGIPKNASTTVGGTIKKAGWRWRRLQWGKDCGKIHHKIFNDDAKYFAIARDPVDRWVSGIIQSFYKHKTDIIDRIINDVTPFIKDPLYDQHQAPQSYYTSGWPNLTAFKIEHLNLLKEWLLDNDIVLSEFVRQNSIKDDGRIELYKKIYDLLSYDHIDSLMEYYKNDVEYYDSAN